VSLTLTILLEDKLALVQVVLVLSPSAVLAALWGHRVAKGAKVGQRDKGDETGRNIESVKQSGGA
jgi:hypothetical protein